MRILPKVLIVALLAGAIAGTFLLKNRQSATSAQTEANEAATMPEPDESTEKGVDSQPVNPAKLDETGSESAASAPSDELPKLIDLGADKCIPCKMMAPILEELKAEYAGRMEVQFIDVWKNPDAGKRYGIQLIPTQIFFDASGTELFRHSGFFSKEDILATWKELGVDLGEPVENKPALVRWTPAQPDERPAEMICYLCDGGINPKTCAVMKTPSGNVRFCSPHCYVITYASLTDESKTHDEVMVTAWDTGALVPVTEAFYLYGMDSNGRPSTKAFADKSAAEAEQADSGGNVLVWEQFEAKETATRCGFCDRPVYPEDASVVRVDGMQTWGCCVMCALGVAARTGKDIEVKAKDALTGEPVIVKTFEGRVAELEPPTAVAWGGARKDADGNIKSTGCFKQAFFSDESNLRAWLEENPTATGRQMTIEQALAAKMKLTPQQISKACKIGECTPK